MAYLLFSMAIMIFIRYIGQVQMCLFSADQNFNAKTLSASSLRLEFTSKKY